LQIVALGQENGPQNVKDGFFFPAEEGTVDAAVVAELFGQVVPLATCSHPKDDAIEGKARIAALTASFGGRIIDGQHFFDQLPERVRDVPERRERLGLGLAFWSKGHCRRFRRGFGLGRFKNFTGRHHVAIIGLSQSHF
jgi:hypothetical protein